MLHLQGHDGQAPNSLPREYANLDDMEKRKEQLLRHEIPRLCSKLASLQDTSILQAGIPPGIE